MTKKREMKYEKPELIALNKLKVPESHGEGGSGVRTFDHCMDGNDAYNCENGGGV